MFSPVPGFSCDARQYPHFVGGQFKLYQISKRLFETTHTQLPALWRWDTSLRGLRTTVATTLAHGYDDDDVVYNPCGIWDIWYTRERHNSWSHFWGARGWIFNFFFEKVVRFHMFYWHRILKLLKLHCVWKDFDMRARRPRACALCVIFCKGWWPWHVRNRCCRSSKSVKKLLAKALFTEMFKKWWVS